MIRAEVRVDDDVLDAIADTAKQSPKLMHTAMRRNMRRLATRLLKPLKKEPPVWRGKRRWKSEKQRRAYFATNGFGAGIPYVRTHGLVRAWRVEFKNNTPASGVITLVNDTHAAQFVQGDFAQPMHLDSGWPQAAPVVAKGREDVNEVAIQTWFTVSDPHAGVPRP